MNERPYEYVGDELSLFSAAKHWKKYVAQLIKPYIHGNVLEAGAGIGANTSVFFNDSVSSWLLLEPDNKFCSLLENMIATRQLPSACTVLNGYTAGITGKEIFDTIIYIDVIEHIEDDRSEIKTAINLLKPGGHLIVLSPAHMFLFSPFDKAIGHFRRYSKKTLLDLADKRLDPIKIIYADCVGFFASLANKYFLKQQYPTAKQISSWDNWMVPVSKIIDRLLFYKCGKTVIAIWRKKQS